MPTFAIAALAFMFGIFTGGKTTDNDYQKIVQDEVSYARAQCVEEDGEKVWVSEDAFIKIKPPLGKK